MICRAIGISICPISVILQPLNINKMRSIKILLMGACMILSISVFAQSTTMKKSTAEKQKIEQVKYSCPMKCEGEKNYDKAGKCPKCGMDLTKSKKAAMNMDAAMVFSCPMKCEGDKIYDKAGKCPKCGMNLTKSKKEEMKMDAMKMYYCPMHADVTSDKPGKCSKCGMNLVEKKTEPKNR